MTEVKPKLSEIETYAFIDASNIRAGCLLTLKLRLDFRKLLKYLKQKYPKFKEARYYEGIATGDTEKEKLFRSLKRAGYEVCTLSRKAYVNPAVYKKVKCRKCGFAWQTQTLKRSIKLKSNVDVYLATDLLKKAYLATKPTHLILFSCDGDYAEMIREAIETNPNVYITVIATPPVKDFARNTLSLRLKNLRQELPERYALINIETIRSKIQE